MTLTMRVTLGVLVGLVLLTASLASAGSASAQSAPGVHYPAWIHPAVAHHHGVVVRQVPSQPGKPGAFTVPRGTGYEWMRNEWFTPGGEPLGKYSTPAQVDELNGQIRSYAAKQGVGTPVANAQATAGQQSAATRVIDRMKSMNSSVAGRAAGIRGQAMSVLQRAKTWPLWSTLGRVSSGLAAFQLGWWAGGKIAGVLGLNSEPEQPPPEEPDAVQGVAMRAVADGELLVSTTTGFGGGQSGHAYAPTAGWYMESEDALLTWTRAENKVNCPHVFNPRPEITGGAPLPTEPPIETASCLNVQSFVSFAPLSVATMPEEGSSSGADKVSGTPAAVPATDLKERTEGILGDPNFGAFNGFLINNNGTKDGQRGSDQKGGVVLVPPGWDEDGTEVIPPEEDDWAVVPTPGFGEEWTVYEDKLEGLGFDVDAASVPESRIDPQYGPNRIVNMDPRPGTLAPKGTEVRIRYNPPDSDGPLQPEGPPTPIPGGGDCQGTTVNPIQWPTVSNLGEKFPFGVLPWVAGAFDSWVISPAAPAFDFDLTPDLTWHVDLAVIEPAMQVVRPVMVIVSAIGFIWMLAASAIGVRGKGDD